MPESGVKEATKTMVAVARLIDVYKTYQSGTVEVPALKGITLEIQDSVFLSIAGPSGRARPWCSTCLVHWTLRRPEPFESADALQGALASDSRRFSQYSPRFHLPDFQSDLGVDRAEERGISAPVNR